MISISYLLDHLQYCPTTGKLWWRKPLQGRRLERPAGRRSKERYVTVGINCKQYAAHILIWAMQTGKWPSVEIDHKNRKRADNRWKNLREATGSQQRYNSGLRSDNTSGCKGVSWMPTKKKWRARAHIAGQEKHLGLFTSRVSARKAYITAVVATRGEYAHF